MTWTDYLTKTITGVNNKPRVFTSPDELDNTPTNQVLLTKIETLEKRILSLENSITTENDEWHRAPREEFEGYDVFVLGNKKFELHLGLVYFKTQTKYGYKKTGSYPYEEIRNVGDYTSDYIVNTNDGNYIIISINGDFAECITYKEKYVRQLMKIVKP